MNQNQSLVTGGELQHPLNYSSFINSQLSLQSQKSQRKVNFYARPQTTMLPNNSVVSSSTKNNEMPAREIKLSAFATTRRGSMDEALNASTVVESTDKEKELKKQMNKSSAHIKPDVLFHKKQMRSNTPFQNNLDYQMSSLFPDLTINRNKIRLQSITPEIAANVVKDYILPMFENDGKKFIKRKNLRKLLNNQSGQPIENPNIDMNPVMHDDDRKKEIEKLKSGKLSNTVYSEMKLSKILQDQINELKEEIRQLNETIQDLYQDKQKMVKRMKDNNMKTIKNNNEMHVLIQQLTISEKQRVMLAMQNQNMEQQIKQLKALFIYNEDSRRQFKQQYRAGLLDLENDVMREKLQRLYDAMDSLGSAKIIEDRYQSKLLIEDQKMRNQAAQIEILQMDIKKYLSESNDQSLFLKDLQVKVANLQVEKIKQNAYFKEKVALLEKDRDEAIQIKETKQEEYIMLLKQFQIIANEREKLKNKIQKLKQRRNIDFNQKICRNCGREYLESEMWWCCGKTGIDAHGCKYSKHESKNEEDEDKDNLDDDLLRQKQLKCFCCKEKGHRTENCPRDPNIRQNMDVSKEDMRIKEIKDNKKLNGDSVLINGKLMEILSKKKQQDIFGQDIMSFDDFNYGLLNDYIFNMIKSTIESQEKSSESSFKIDDDDDERQQQQSQTSNSLTRKQTIFSHQMNSMFKRQTTTKPKKLFNKGQVNQIIESQNNDVFNELINIKMESVIENLRTKNFINLEDELGMMITHHENLKKTKSKRGQSVQGSTGSKTIYLSQTNSMIHLKQDQNQTFTPKNGQFLEVPGKNPLDIVKEDSFESSLRSHQNQSPQKSLFHIQLRPQKWNLDNMNDINENDDNGLRESFEHEAVYPVVRLSQQNVQQFEQDLKKNQEKIRRMNSFKAKPSTQSPSIDRQSFQNLKDSQNQKIKIMLGNDEDSISKENIFNERNKQNFKKHVEVKLDPGTPRRALSNEALSNARIRSQMAIQQLNNSVIDNNHLQVNGGAKYKQNQVNSFSSLSSDSDLDQPSQLEDNMKLKKKNSLSPSRKIKEEQKIEKKVLRDIKMKQKEKEKDTDKLKQENKKQSKKFVQIKD
ncbi:ankyrin repeat domain containing protein [Stylonychia lemnae]|uniref:Ankyrin repeat domain containing protein n=1 Tax=Stylonychia lemnae TaxID=5949 RepID=A0A078A844_STYLE|nr:ankyrin repeat domain containing protein [Stylonychia lemnae]|eukprot:CDW78389.1 ankyrin repeat domain containing protein [Stylonychia lemnae]